MARRSYLHVFSVLFALAEKGVAYRLQPADAAPLLSTERERAAAQGEPIIEVGGKLVTGVEVALCFVADGFLGPRLQPEDPFERAQMNLALEIHYREAVVTIGLRITGRYLAAMVANEWLDPATSEAILRDARKIVATFEALLGTGPFLAGNQFSLADIALASLRQHRGAAGRKACRTGWHKLGEIATVGVVHSGEYL